MSFYRGKYAIAVIEKGSDLIEALYDDYEDMAKRLGLSKGATAKMLHRQWLNLQSHRKRYNAYIGPRIEFVDMFEEWRGKPLSDFIRDWDEFTRLHLKIFENGRKRRFKNLRSRAIKALKPRIVKEIQWTKNVILIWL